MFNHVRMTTFYETTSDERGSCNLEIVIMKLKF